MTFFMVKQEDFRHLNDPISEVKQWDFRPKIPLFMEKTMGLKF